MKTPRDWPRVMTGSSRGAAWQRSVMRPNRLSHQKATGTTESRLRSEAIHCARNLAVKINWPAKPIESQIFVSVVIAQASLAIVRAEFDAEDKLMWLVPFAPGIGEESTG